MARLCRAAKSRFSTPKNVLNKNVGNASANMSLGQRRTDSVKSYFVQEHGIISERLESISYGDSRPVATNETEKGRAQNRRVEVH